MPYIKPISLGDLDEEAASDMQTANELMGFQSNDALTMARVPGLLKASAALVGAIYKPGKLDIETKRLAAYVTSRAAGCRYCEAHTAYGADRAGISPEKFSAVWEFERSSLFSDGEKAVLRLARDSAQSADPDPELMQQLGSHYSDDQIAELVAVLALFAFLNRWNTTLATDLEDAPFALAEKRLSADGWSAGQHAAIDASNPTEQTHERSAE